MGVLESYAKLRENQAFGILRRPALVANYLRHKRENRVRPVVMRSQPVGVEIELSNRCNLACVQCLRSQGLRPFTLGDISFDTFRRVLREFPYLLNLSLNGFGEALLHPQLFEIVRYAREKLPWAKIGIYSNAMLLDEPAARELLLSGLTEIDVSIDAARPDTFERVRRGGDIETVHGNIERFVRLRRKAGQRLPMIGVNFVMLNENEGELVPFVEQAKALGVDFVNCITYAAYDWGFRNQRSPESYRRELVAARARLDELGLRCKSFPSDDLSWTDPHKRFSCGFFWGEEFRVTFEGHVTLGCCVPFKETYSYGSLLETSFQEIWNGPKFQRNRELAREGVAPTRSCVSCDRFGREFFALPRTASSPSPSPSSPAVAG